MTRQGASGELEELARVLDREAAHLDGVRVALRRAVEATRGSWEGLVADRFRGHDGAAHRQHHLAVAGDRLRQAARLSRLVAAEHREQPAAPAAIGPADAMEVHRG